MARSTHVYVVDVPNGPLVAAFTVKHELISWLRRHRSDVLWCVYRVTRLGDNSEAVPVVLPIDELLGEIRRAR